MLTLVGGDGSGGLRVTTARCLVGNVRDEATLRTKLETILALAQNKFNICQ